MTFAQLMEFNMATAMTIALITTTIGSLKEAMTANATSIARLVLEMKEAKKAARLSGQPVIQIVHLNPISNLTPP